MADAKICTKCEESLPLSAFGKHSGFAGGLNSRCKKCCAIYVAQWSADNAARRAATNKAWRERSGEATKAVAKVWYEANKEQKLAKRRERYRANKDAETKKNAEWRAANLKRALENARAYGEANKDRLLITAAQWRERNKHKMNATVARRRAAKFLAVPSWADNKKMAVFYREALRITVETGVPHEVDHIVPLQSPYVCGLHCQNNLQVGTMTANRRKGNRRWPDMGSLADIIP